MTIVTHQTPDWRTPAKDACEMTPNRYVSSTALASDLRSRRYRESAVDNQNIHTSYE
jgi:hypothetical protein